MNCPKCNKPMKVSNTYNAGDSAKTQRLQCSDDTCPTTGIAVVLVVSIDPVVGLGAKSLAKQIREGKVKMPPIRHAVRIK